MSLDKQHYSSEKCETYQLALVYFGKLGKYASFENFDDYGKNYLTLNQTPMSC